MTAQWQAGQAQFFAPGRINLIGEHIDYSLGRVLPAALSLGTTVRVRPGGPSHDVHVSSTRSDASLSLPLGGTARPRGQWSDYVQGVIWALEKAGHRLTPVRLEIDSNLPSGAGLSSSAALEVASALALLHAASGAEPPSPLALAQLCQLAENEFVGARCGLMDQFASVFGRAGHALLFDCAALTSRPVRLPADGTWIVANTMVHHALATGAYNERRAQSEALARAAQSRFGAGTRPVLLRDLSDAQCAELANSLDPTLARRLRHIVQENRRVLRMVEALEHGALGDVGALLNASHASLRDDFDVSCEELDTMVDLAQGLPGVAGARLLGGGFGGCALVLSERTAAPAVLDRLRESYRAARGVDPWMHRCEIGDGARRVEGVSPIHDWH